MVSMLAIQILDKLYKSRQNLKMSLDFEQFIKPKNMKTRRKCGKVSKTDNIIKVKSKMDKTLTTLCIK